MKLLNALQIMACIHKARRLNEKGLLKHSIKNITVPEFWICPENPSIIKKQILIQMAINNEPKPNKDNHPLGRILRAYLSPKASCYDPIFTNKLKAIRPDWFINQSEEANKKKQILLQMAKSNQPRPNQKKHPLGPTLGSYTKKSSASYDPAFTQQIKSIAPNWFIYKSDIANQKKQTLLHMAKQKKPRPNQKTHPLGKVISAYITKNHTCYDPIFTKKLKKLAPNWFISPSHKATKNKKLLLQMAKQGKTRPNCKKHPIGKLLNNYLLDPIFNKQIKQLAPHWFKK